MGQVAKGVALFLTTEVASFEGPRAREALYISVEVCSQRLRQVSAVREQLSLLVCGSFFIF